MTGIVSVVVACIAIHIARPLVAQELEIPRIDGAITLDGLPTEPTWATAESLSMTMFEPVFDSSITRESSVRIGHDGEFLYAAGTFVDDGAVRANSLIRDHAGEDDFFNLVIDSFDDDETALWFLVTPAGTRVDGAITDDAEGASWNHPEFDNIWDAAAQITEDGWSAEMRIPLSSLRYEASDETVRMGLIAGRVIVRLRERHTYPAIRPGPAVAHYKPSLAGTVVLHGVASKRPFEVRPYALGGWSQEQRAGEENGAVHEVGADVKVPVGHHSTLDLTINTDFAQTESDDERLNLNRFDLYYPEKRQFFLERSGIFDVGDDEDHRLFYSRRIGRSAAGEPERIYGGARLTGRTGTWEYGALSIQTDERTDGSINRTAIRLRRRVLNPLSQVGGIATAVLGGEAGVVAAGGLDADIHVGRSHFLSVTSALSRDSAAALAGSTRFTAEKRNKAGYAYRLNARHVESDYRPPLGFIRRSGISTLYAQLSHGSFSGSGFLQERVLASDVYVVRRHVDDELETANWSLGLEAKRRGGGEGTAVVRARHEDVLETFAVGKAVVPAGTYTFMEAELTLRLPDSWSRRAALAVSGGTYFDGSRLTVAMTPTWKVSRHLEVTADLETNWIRFPDRRQRFRGDIARLRIRASPDEHLSLYALVQYNGAFDRAAANFRLRYNFSEGRDFYVLWNEGWERVDDRERDDEWRAARRSLLIKYSQAIWW